MTLIAWTIHVCSLLIYTDQYVYPSLLLDYGSSYDNYLNWGLFHTHEVDNLENSGTVFSVRCIRMSTTTKYCSFIAKSFASFFN